MLVGEKRNAFPLDVPAGETHIVWIDVFVPAAAGAGNHTATVKVKHSEGTIDLDVDVEVLGFTLPSTPSLRSIFGFGGGSRLVAAHKLADPTGPDATALVRRYARASVRTHRLHLDHACANNHVLLV